MSGPLSGVRILDCGWIIAAPLASRLLADFGAQVIKIESSTRPDVARGNRVPLFGELPGDANTNADTGGYFQDVNAGKLSVTLNLTTSGGLDLLKRLAAVSDAIVCNLAGDQLERWGIGYEQVRAINPGIIVVTMPTMETSGPRARWRAFGDNFAAMAGLKSLTGQPDEPPLSFGHHYADFSASPFHAVIALMAALLHRDRTNEGQFIELSQYESTASLVGAALLEFSASGRVPLPMGNYNPQAAPHNLYPCRGDDSWCAISVHTDEEWQALAGVEGLEALRSPEYATLSGRLQHSNAIDAVLDAWTANWDRHELAEFLQRRGVPAGPLQTTEDHVHRDPVLGERYFTKLLHPVGREFLVHGNPIQARSMPSEVKLAPLLGEHTFQVLSEVLGLTPDEIAEYAASGALD